MTLAEELLVKEVHIHYTSIYYTSRLAITTLFLPSDTTLKGFLILYQLEFVILGFIQHWRLC